MSKRHRRLTRADKVAAAAVLAEAERVLRTEVVEGGPPLAGQRCPTFCGAACTCGLLAAMRERFAVSER